MVYLIYLGILNPIQKNIEYLDKKIEKSKKQLNKQQKTIRKGEHIDQGYEQYWSMFKQQGSDEQVMSSILTEIESAVKKENMRISDLKPKPVRREDFYNNFSVGLSINGPLKDILEYLYILQNTPHLFNVEELQIEKNSPLASELYCRVVLTRILIPWFSQNSKLFKNSIDTSVLLCEL